MKKFGMFAVLLVLVVAGSATLLSESLQPVLFRLNWMPTNEGDHAVFFVAQSLGYYEEAGLDVTIESGSGSADAVRFLEVGKADIAIADFTSIAVARAEGADITIVAAYQANCPFTIWTRVDTGIETINDLAGHTIGAPAGDAQRIAFPALAGAVGLDPDSVEWVSISGGAKTQSLAAGAIDATVHFIPSLPLYLRTIGEDNLRYFFWADYGVNPFGLSFIVHSDTLEEDPDMVRKFLGATYRAVRWTILHPAEAIEIMQSYLPEIDFDHFVANIKVAIQYNFLNDNVLSHGLGYITAEAMADSVAMMNKYFVMSRDLTAEEMYTMSLLPHFTWPYPAELEDPSTWPLSFVSEFQR